MHLASLTEIHSHCVFTDPQIIDYCSEEKWKKKSKYGRTFSHQANKRELWLSGILFFFFFAENRTRWLDVCTVTKSLVLTTFELIFTHVPVKGRAVWPNYTKRKTQEQEIYFWFETFFHHLSCLFAFISTNVNLLFFRTVLFYLRNQFLSIKNGRQDRKVSVFI